MQGIQLDLFGNHEEVRRSPSLPYALEILQNREPPDPNAPLVVSYGGGRNSTAMLIGMWSKGIVPDLILFADTGGEKPGTYQFIELFSDWLISKSMPEITVVSRADKIGRSIKDWKRQNGLEDECLRNKRLPSKAYGFSQCSIKWKHEPQEIYLNHRFLKASQIRKVIGFHAGETQRLFNRKSGEPILTDGKYYNEYPMILWEWHQGRCEAVIQASGLPMPPKSACFFCPNMKSNEIRELAANHPELIERAIEIERNSAENNSKVKGLGRRFSWEELIKSSQPNEYFVHDVIPDCMCNDG